MRDIIVFSVIFLFLQLFSLLTFKGLDYNAKKSNKKLIEINKFKWLFIHYKENSNKLGKVSFIMQLVHYFISIILCSFMIIHLISYSGVLFNITFKFCFSYLVFFVVFMVVVIFQSLKIDEKLEKEKNSIKDNEKGKD